MGCFSDAYRWRGAMLKSSLLGVIAMALASVSEPARATEIDIPPGTFFLTGVSSETRPYRGQTFTAEPGFADELTLYLGAVEGGTFSFRVLLTEIAIDTGIPAPGGLHPTNVLFESPTFSKSGFSAAPLIVPLGGIPLVAGQKYAWLLDAFVTSDLNISNPSMSTALAAAPYSDGEGFDFIGAPGGISGSRSQHCAASRSWFVRTEDFAFRLSVSPIPEPSSFQLVGAGLGGLAVYRHSRKRALAR